MVSYVTINKFVKHFVNSFFIARSPGQVSSLFLSADHRFFVAVLPHLLQQANNFTLNMSLVGTVGQFLLCHHQSRSLLHSPPPKANLLV